MELKTKIFSITTIAFILIWAPVHPTKLTETSKPGTTFSLCGEAFLDVYAMVCTLKKSHGQNPKVSTSSTNGSVSDTRKRRSVEGNHIR